MNLALRQPMTLAEFLEWEERQELRYEFDGVEPVAMAGGTATHSDIQRNLAIAVGSRLRGTPCKFHGSDLKILVGKNSSRYPDGMVVCSPVAPNATVREPVVIFEVLSPSTAAKDRIVKAREYQATPSVKRYVMLEQERIGATVLVHAQDGWSADILKDNDTLDMPEIGLAIRLSNSTKASSLPTMRSKITMGNLPPRPDRFWPKSLPLPLPRILKSRLTPAALSEASRTIRLRDGDVQRRARPDATPMFHIRPLPLHKGSAKIQVAFSLVRRRHPVLDFTNLLAEHPSNAKPEDRNATQRRLRSTALAAGSAAKRPLPSS